MGKSKRTSKSRAAEQTCQRGFSLFQENSPFIASPHRAMIITAILILAAESALMLAIFLFPTLPVPVEAALHALLLTILLLPLLYFFVLKPVKSLLAMQSSLEKLICEAEDRERKRIGQRLHDQLGQILTGVAFQLKVLEKKLEDPLPEESRYTAEISSHVNRAAQEVRLLAKDLHSSDSEDKRQPMRER